MKKLIPFIFLYSTLLLSGCVGIGSEFDCNISSGGKCLPMDQINNMTTAGIFNR